jgi:hypothetical protein
MGRLLGTSMKAPKLTISREEAIRTQRLDDSKTLMEQATGAKGKDWKTSCK